MPHVDTARIANFEEDLEERYVQACRILSAATKPNITGIAQQLKLPYHTLRRRFLGLARPRKEAHESQMLLSPPEEETIVDWILYLAATGHPVDKRAIRSIVKEVCSKRPSGTWINLFLWRHPNVKLGKAHGLDPRRAQAFNRPVVGRYFAKLQRIIKDYNIPPENIYNMDEKGVQRGGGKKSNNRKYFVGRNSRTNYKAASANLELITIIECVSLDGALDPGFVFPGKEFCPEWFETPNITVSMSPNGWTDNNLNYDWFDKSFIPQSAQRNTSGGWRLLIHDGHGSHDTVRLIELARKHKIILFCLPPHTTHKLQPLDVGVFGPFQSAWIDRCHEVVEETGQEMAKEDFILEYMAVRAKTFKKSTIKSAWKSSGAWPIDPDVFTDEDYAPSIPFSTATVDLPASYPVDLPIDLDEFLGVDTFQSINSIRATLLPEGVDPDSDSDSDSDDDELSSVIPPDEFYTTPSRHSHLSMATPSTSASTPCPSSCRRTRSMKDTPNPPKRRRLNTGAYIRHLEAENARLKTHCAVAGNQMMSLKRKMNTRAAKKNGKAKLNVEARTLTSDEGLRMAQDRENLTQEKEADKQRRDDERQAKEKEEQRLREAEAGTAIFRGAISGKNKPQLKDLAYALNLSMEGKSKELVARITEHFDNHEALREHPRFSGIFNRSRAPASIQPAAGTALADVSNFDINAVAGPSHLANSDATFNFNLADQSFPNNQYPPYAFNNPTLFDTHGPFTPIEGGGVYHPYNAFMYDMPDLDYC